MRFLAVLLLLWPVLRPAPALADCVVLLHGLARTEASFTVMDEVLRGRGYDVVRPGYPSTDLPIPELAARAVPAALAECGPQRVHFVAHSMGGILLRYWLKDHKPRTLGRVVMLGPPNQGSQLVDELDDWQAFGMLNGPAGKQLGTGPGSIPRALPPVDFPLGVIAGTNSVNPVFTTLIDGPDDGKVAVAETKVAGMTAHLTLPVTHTFMMNNPRVIAQAVHFIETGRFDPEITWLDALLGEIDKVCLMGNCPSEPHSEPTR